MKNVYSHCYNIALIPALRYFFLVLWHQSAYLLDYVCKGHVHPTCIILCTCRTADCMWTSWHRNTFPISCRLCGVHHKKVSEADLWYFLWSLPEPNCWTSSRIGVRHICAPINETITGSDMGCSLSSAKPSHEPLLVYQWLDVSAQSSVKFQSKRIRNMFCKVKMVIILVSLDVSRHHCNPKVKVIALYD